LLLTACAVRASSTLLVRVVVLLGSHGSLTLEQLILFHIFFLLGTTLHFFCDSNVVLDCNGRIGVALL
jgi:hypothetical protein